jgi:hypothetical protein
MGESTGADSVLASEGWADGEEGDAEAGSEE